MSKPLKKEGKRPIWEPPEPPGWEEKKSWEGKNWLNIMILYIYICTHRRVYPTYKILVSYILSGWTNQGYSLMSLCTSNGCQRQGNKSLPFWIWRVVPGGRHDVFGIWSTKNDARKRGNPKEKWRLEWNHQRYMAGLLIAMFDVSCGKPNAINLSFGDNGYPMLPIYIWWLGTV